MPDLTEYRQRVQRASNKTPWGRAETKEIIADGITFYSTPSHGGYKVHKRLLKKMPKRLVNLDGWYEEDAEWCKVVVAFPQYFTETLVNIAKDLLEKFYDEKGEWKHE